MWPMTQTFWKALSTKCQVNHHLSNNKKELFDNPSWFGTYSVTLWQGKLMTSFFPTHLSRQHLQGSGLSDWWDLQGPQGCSCLCNRSGLVPGTSRLQVSILDETYKIRHGGGACLQSQHSEGRGRRIWCSRPSSAT